MARRGRGSARGVARRSGPKNQIWTVVTANELAITTGSTSISSIVQDSDWTSGQGQERATILRVRGWLNFGGRVNAGVTGEGIIGAYISVQADEVTPTGALLTASYIDQDILWTSGHFFPLVATAEPLPSFDTVIDIKAMRRIRAGQRMTLVVTNNLADGTVTSFVVRALVKRGGA